MDPRRNPFAPGAGTPPPELAGREALRERVAVALDRIGAGRSSQSVILYGLRGVGKTVLLAAMRRDAEAAGMAVIAIEAPEGRSLPAVLAPALRAALLRLDRLKGVGDKVRRALSALAGFVKLKATYGDLAIAIEHESEPGLADSGDLEADLIDLIRALGEAAAERLFAFETIGALDAAAADAALRHPIEEQGERIDPDAIAAIYAATEGYAYFLQEWGKQSWDVAQGSPITATDVATAQASVLAQLDQSFFRVRLDRLSPAEKRYVQAMAQLGAGAQRSGEIAQAMGVKVTTVAPIRSSLIAKGMVYSPGHGDTAFTVPMFDGFVRRTVIAAP